MNDKNMRIINRIGIKDNQKSVEAYYNKLLARGLSPQGIYKNLACLAKFSELLGRPFKEAALEDIEGAMAHIENNGYAENTKNLFRMTVKAFFGAEDLRVSWIHVRGRVLNPKLPEDLISREELEFLISCARTREKKALLAFLYDSAIRPREFLMLEKKHIVLDGPGMFVMIPDAKTPARTIYLVESRKWLKDIPFGKLTYAGMASFFKRMQRHSGKRFYPYILRHSRITELSKTWSDSMLKKFAGWTQSSPMPQVYVHLSNNDLRETMLRGFRPAPASQQFISLNQEIRCAA